MAITTYTSYINALGDLVVSGVTTRKDGPPASVETADLPLSFPRPLTTADTPLTFQASGGWPILRAELVVVIEPIGQSNMPENQAATVAVVDGINDALRADTAPALGLGKSPLIWNCRLTPALVLGGRQYWAVIATVEGRG